MKKLINRNIKKLDELIGRLVDEMSDETLTPQRREEAKANLELTTDIRSKLQDSKVKGSSKDSVLKYIGAAVCLLLILHYEKTEIITSKAFGIATKFIGV